MITALLALALTPAVYGLGPSQKLNYDVTLGFDGFLPVMGGNQGEVKVDMGIKVEGLAPKEKDLQAASTLTGFSLSYNGAPLGLGVETVQEYVPRTVTRMTPAGKVVATDAPNRSLPVRLPGLDIKRLADITYLPLEFPEGGVSVGDVWSFSKAFADSPMKYDCRVVSIDGNRLKVGVKTTQEYENLEDEALQVVKDAKDACAKVKTTMAGAGEVEFDLVRGVVLKSHIKSDSTSISTDLKSGEATERKLTMTLDAKLKEPKPAPGKAPAKTPAKVSSAQAGLWDKAQGWWQVAKGGAQSTWQQAKGCAALAQMAYTAGMNGPAGSWLEAMFGRLNDVVPAPPKR